MRSRGGKIIMIILLGMLSSGCALFYEKDVNKRAGKAQLQDHANANDGVQIVIQKGHSDMIQAVVLSQNGRTVLTGSVDETARVWDVSSGQMIRSFVGFTILGPQVLAFGLAGQVVVGDQQTVKVYEVTTGREVRSINVRESERVVVSPDGRVLAMARGTMATKVELWDLTTGQELSQDPVGSLAIPLVFSLDGHMLVTQRRVAGFYTGVTLWELATGKKVKTVDHSGQVRAAALSSDGRMLALQAPDRTIVVKDVDTGRVLQKLLTAVSQETGRTTGLRFSPDSRMLATADSENLVRLWDVQTGRESRTYRGTAVDFSEDGKSLVLGVMEGTPLIRDLAGGAETKFSSGGTTAVIDVAVTTDGRKALAAMDDGTVKLWDLTTGQILRSLAGPAESSIAISRIGGLLATAGGSYGSVTVWQFMTGRKLLTVIPPHGNDMDILDRTVVSLSSDGSLLAVGLRDQVGLYDVASGIEMHHLTIKNQEGIVKKLAVLDNAIQYVLNTVTRGRENVRRESWVKALALSPDGRYLAISMDAGIYLLDTKTGEFERRVAIGLGITKEQEEELHAVANMTDVHSLAFSGDGETLIGVGPTWKRRWEELHPSLLKRFGWGLLGYDPSAYHAAGGYDSKREIGYRGLAITLDGKVAVMGHGRLVKMWDAENDKDLLNLIGHTANVTAVAMTPDGRHVVSGSQDGTLKVWDAKTGKELASLIALGQEDYVAVTPDQYYRVSRSRLKGVAFRVKDQLFPFEQFDLQFNRPDIVLKRLGWASEDTIASYHYAYQKRLKKTGLTEQMLGTDLHVPIVAIVSSNVPVTTSASTLTLAVRASDTKYKLDRLNIFVNDVPVYGTAGITLREKAIQVYEQDVSIPLGKGRNKIQVSVLNQQGVESLKQTVYITSTAQVASPDVYIVGIGVSEYKNQAYNLRYAAKDANDLIAFYKAVEQRQGTRSKVHTLNLSDQKATRAEIMKAKEWLKQSKINDLVVVFAAGHGMTDEQSNYYFGTHDIDPTNPAANGLPYQEFENLLDGIPALQKVLLLDTCFSGEIEKDQAVVVAQVETGGSGSVKMRSFKAARGVSVVAEESATPASAETNAPRLSNDMLGFQQDWFADLRRGTGAAVISSSSGNEYSLEGEQWKNGVFTYTLLNGLKNREADANHDETITVSELQAYVIDQVRKLTQGGQNPTVRRENLEADFVVY